MLVAAPSFDEKAPSFDEPFALAMPSVRCRACGQAGKIDRSGRPYNIFTDMESGKPYFSFMDARECTSWVEPAQPDQPEPVHVITIVCPACASDHSKAEPGPEPRSTSVLGGVGPDNSKAWTPPPRAITEYIESCSLPLPYKQRLHFLAEALAPHLDLTAGKNDLCNQEIISGFEDMAASGFAPDITLEMDPEVIRCDPEVWWRQSVNITMHDGTAAFDSARDGASVIFYHGTIAKVAWLIIQSGAFIPGPNGHTRAKRHFRGCFGSVDFGTASFRGDMTRGNMPGGVYDFSCCPVVLELQASHANCRRYHKKNRELLVVAGVEGEYLPGILLRAVHWAPRFVKNYRALHSPSAREAIINAGGVFNACCGLGRQRQDFQSCGTWTRDVHAEFIKFGGVYVCRPCHKRWTTYN